MATVNATGSALHPFERRFVDRLRSAPRSWQVLPGLRWVSAASGNRMRGEIDVLVLVPGTGALVIEIKSGRHRVGAGDQWYDGTAVAKQTPYEQAILAAYQLGRHLGGFEIRIPVFPYVVFSTMPEREVAELRLPPGVAYGKTHAEEPTGLLSNIARGLPDVEFSRADAARVANVLRPGFATLLPLGDELARSETRLASRANRVVKLTQAQARALTTLGSEVSVGIRGPAGTGKTLVAVERAAGLAMTGHRVLYALGAGRLLGERIEAEMARRNLEVDVAVGPDIWRKFERVHSRFGSPVNECIARYDAVILDEAQRLSGESESRFLRAVKLVPLVYFFGDAQQASADQAELPSFLNTKWLDLRENCRNTIAIARAAKGFAPWVKFETDVDGPPPIVIPAPDAEARKRHLSAVLRHFASEGIDASQTAVLSTSETAVEEMKNELRKDGWEPDRFVACCSVLDFIGMEAQAAVIVDLQHAPMRAFRWVITSQKRELYLAVTRARGLLAFIGTPKTTEWLVRAGAETSPASVWHP